MNGCMSLVLRSFFSYQLAVGRTMSEYRQVVLMRKSSVTSRSSLPCGACSCHFTSDGLASSAPRSWPCTPLLVPSRCLQKYSCPLPLEPSRLLRHTNRLRGQFSGASGSSQLIDNVPFWIDWATKSRGERPAASAMPAIFKGFVPSCGALGSQPMRSARTL
ncbi:hypothetical protein FQZ97_991220 [compost metagenome]